MASSVSLFGNVYGSGLTQQVIRLLEEEKLSLFVFFSLSGSLTSKRAVTIPFARFAARWEELCRTVDSTGRVACQGLGTVHDPARTCGRPRIFPGRGSHVRKDNQARARPWAAQLGRYILPGVVDPKGRCVGPHPSHCGPHRCSAALTTPNSSAGLKSLELGAWHCPRSRSHL